MAENDIITTALPKIPDLIESDEEGQSLLVAYESLAADLIARSTKQLSIAILCLHRIRERGLFLYGGYRNWEDFIRDFRAHRGISRALTFDHLRVVRQALGGMGLTEDQFREIGLYRLKPVTEIVAEYDASSGEIRALKPGIAKRLPSGDTPGDQLREWVLSEIDPDTDTPRTVREKLRQDVPHRPQIIITRELNAEYQWVDIVWEIVRPDGTEDAGVGFREMPADLQAWMCRRLYIQEGIE
jgi:hypothetical protein